MPDPNEKFFAFTDNHFTFNNLACDCVTDIENIRPGEVKKTVKLQGLADSPLRFAFAPDKGMVRLARSGAINSDRILTELLALPDCNTEKLFGFFRDYGFFFPIRTDGYEAVEPALLHGLINRIKAVVRLMSELGEPNKHYLRILGLVLYLQLSPPVTLSLQSFGAQPFSTFIHPLMQATASAASFPQRNAEPYDAEVYTIPDTVFAPSCDLIIDQYNNIVGGFDAATPGAVQSQLYKDVTRLYCNAPSLPPELRMAVDLLFHFQQSVGVIKNYTADGSVEFYDTSANIRARLAANFSESIKQSLLATAKVTVRDEVGYNLEGMRPCYDVGAMSPAWEIQDMLTGIYVSIFYMRPRVELYRRCANPNCGRSFLVSTTSSKRKYCDAPCRNASSQRAHRLRQKVSE